VVAASIGVGGGRRHLSHYFDAKAKFYQKKEIKAYEKISGVICSCNVFCDFYVDWLQSTSGTSST
jgi:hypothetical protein